MKLTRIIAGTVGLAAVLAAGTALAQQIGQPTAGGLGMQAAASPIKEEMHHFHNILLVIITGITLFVMALLGYVMVRFRRSANPVPSKVTHNTLLEVAWTVVPILILLAIVVPSIRLIYMQDHQPDAEMTIKVVGRQWYWSYEYPDNGNFAFDSYMIPDDQIDPAKGQVRLLSVDNEVVIPADTKVRFIITGGDVIHSWAIPALGIKMDAVPGRLNEAWTLVPAKYIGTVFYGQCSEICGINHGFMPAAVRVVSKEDYVAWVEKAQQQFAAADAPATMTVAALAAQ